MAQGNQDIAYNNSLANVEASLQQVVVNTADDWSTVVTSMCDVQGNGAAVPVIRIAHYKSGSFQTAEYRTYLGANYTVTGTLGNCSTPSGAPDYSTILATIGTNTLNTKNSVDTVTSTLGSTNTSLASIDTGIQALNAKLNQSCAGNPIKVSVCNPVAVDFTATNNILSNILTVENTTNSSLTGIDSKIATTNTKLDNVTTALGTINTKLNESCAGNPIKVQVCNQPSALVDFTPTNNILSNILTQDTSTANNTSNINTAITTTNTKLDTVNASLTTIATKLNENCAGNPIKVQVCNPATVTVDFSSTNAILTSIDNKTTTVATNTGDTSTKLTATNTKLDTANTNLTNIYNKLNATCGSTPINVNVCNPATVTVDFTSTNAILNNILTQDSNTATNTASIDSKLTTANSSLATIANVLGQTCAGTPLKVSVCNQIDLTTAQNSLASIDSKLTTVVTNTGTTATNTTAIAASNTTIATNTGNTKTSVDAVNTNITSLKTQLTQTNTNHVVVDNFPAAAPSYNTNKIRTVTTTTGSLTLAANTFHSISVSIVKGTATIAYGGGSVVAPEGYTNNMEATTTLANQVVITATAVGDLVIVTTIE